MGTLDIAAHDLSRVLEHARSSYPDECCGILSGNRGARAASVVRVRQTENAEQGLARRGYRIPEHELLEAHLAARDEGLEVVGYYHSHPETDSRPSRLDLERAWPGVSYLIVAVDGQNAHSPRSWKLAVDERVFEEEQVRVSCDGDPTRGVE